MKPEESSSMILSPFLTSTPLSMIHLMEVAMVLPLVPERTVQIMSPFLADSREPRSTMVTFNFSNRTVAVLPVNGFLPNKLPVIHKRTVRTATPRRPTPNIVPAVRLVLHVLARGRREEPCPRDDGWRVNRSPLVSTDWDAGRGWAWGDWDGVSGFIGPYSSIV